MQITSRFALALIAFTFTACDMRLPTLAIHGVAVRGDDDALREDVKAKELGVYVLYKSATCANPGSDSCLDDRAVGNVLPEADGAGLLVPITGNSLPSDEFARGSEAAYGNVRFTNDDHPQGTWAYGLLLLA